MLWLLASGMLARVKVRCRILIYSVSSLQAQSQHGLEVK